MADLFKGEDCRLLLNAKDFQNPSSPIDFALDDLVQLEYWIYVVSSDIKKYHKGTVLKTGYQSLLIRDDANNYHINFLGSVNKTMKCGEIIIDIFASFSDDELTELKQIGTIKTGVNLKDIPISAI